MAFGDTKQADRSNKSPVSLAGYSKRSPLLFFKFLLVLGNPFLGNSIFIGVRDVLGGVRNGSVSGQSLDFSSIVKTKGAEHQSFSLQRRYFFHNKLLLS